MPVDPQRNSLGQIKHNDIYGLGTPASPHSLVFRTAAEYYSSASGGHRLFNSTSGVIPLGSAGGVAFLFSNPAGSGVDAVIYKIVLGSSLIGNFRRFRKGSFTINSGATSQPAVNRSGGTTIAQAKPYLPSSVTVVADSGTLGKISMNAANGSDPDIVGGTITVPPNDNIYWSFASATNSAANTSIEVVWWEVPAAG